MNFQREKLTSGTLGNGEVLSWELALSDLGVVEVWFPPAVGEIVEP